MILAPSAKMHTPDIHLRASKDGTNSCNITLDMCPSMDILISFHLWFDLWFLNVQLFLYHFMHFYLSKMTQFIQSSILNEIQPFSYHLTKRIFDSRVVKTKCYSQKDLTDITDGCEQFVKTYTTYKFILNAPIWNKKNNIVFSNTQTF